jgi:hypothetical protein
VEAYATSACQEIGEHAGRDLSDIFALQDQMTESAAIGANESVTDVRMEHLEGVIGITGIVRFYC